MEGLVYYMVNGHRLIVFWTLAAVRDALKTVEAVCFAGILLTFKKFAHSFFQTLQLRWLSG